MGHPSRRDLLRPIRTRMPSAERQIEALGPVAVMLAFVDLVVFAIRSLWRAS